MKINVYCYRCGSSLDVIEDYAEGYPFSGIVLKVEPCADCSKDDVEPDFVELLNNEVKWHENNIVQDENTEKQDAFINGIRQAIFLIVKAKRGLTSRAADETICDCSHDVYENVVNPGHCMACGKPFRR